MKPRKITEMAGMVYVVEHLTCRLKRKLPLAKGEDEYARNTTSMQG